MKLLGPFEHTGLQALVAIWIRLTTEKNGKIASYYFCSVCMDSGFRGWLPHKCKKQNLPNFSGCFEHRGSQALVAIWTSQKLLPTAPILHDLSPQTSGDVTHQADWQIALFSWVNTDVKNWFHQFTVCQDQFHNTGVYHSMAGPQYLFSYHCSRGRKPCGHHTRLSINMMTTT